MASVFLVKITFKCCYFVCMVRATALSTCVQAVILYEVVDYTSVEAVILYKVVDYTVIMHKTY